MSTISMIFCFAAYFSSSWMISNDPNKAAKKSGLTVEIHSRCLSRAGWGQCPRSAALAIVVTTGIKPSSNIGSALVSAMYGRRCELGLYLWGN